MRTSLLAGFVAASVVFASINAAPVMAQTDTPDPAASTPAENTGNTENKADGNKDDGAMDANAPADAAAALIDTRNAFRELSAATGQDGEGSSLEALDRDPENDPLYIDPEKNPLKKVSSSEMFLSVTGEPAEGEEPDVAQAWAANSSIPDTANPVELWKQEAQGSAMMSSGLFNGDFAQSSAGSSQATSVIIPVMIGVAVIGQIIELIMRGVRMATR
ncbi:hypothetical protein [Corynebacterium jeddahense]|uniref:Secreted protein n=1 Tax=Corynebacterium jeddahense TaxID=1414719 RepID=A0ABY7UJ47_9CORY|nr:hypothetical protein [Corynebacterium jeddahense]WCZ37739.1 hypothetical protein CJEDD_00520 [Corynebacterium jeddahense]